MTREPRQRIVEAAMELFWTKGYNSTSVADLLSRTQLHSGSLYHFFPSKQDVLVGVLEAYRDGIRQMLLEPAWRGVKDPIARIFALLRFYRGALLETECTYGCPIGSLALELHEPDLKVRQLLAENFDGWVRAVEGCLHEAKAELPPRVDLRALAEFVLITMEGGVMLTRTHRDVAYFDRAIQQLELHVTSLRRRSSTKEKSRVR